MLLRPLVKEYEAESGEAHQHHRPCRWQWCGGRNRPVSENIQIAKALLGQGEKKVLILAVRKAKINDKGEILDPWMTPLMFYFANNEVLIRSAGPNKAWEDSASPGADDLYRCVGVEKK